MSEPERYLMPDWRRRPRQSCRLCKHAYTRTNATKDYAYEACALGATIMTFNLPSNRACDLFERASEERLAETLEPIAVIEVGEPINIIEGGEERSNDRT